MTKLIYVKIEGKGSPVQTEDGKGTPVEAAQTGYHFFLHNKGEKSPKPSGKIYGGEQRTVVNFFDNSMRDFSGQFSKIAGNKQIILYRYDGKVHIVGGQTFDTIKEAKAEKVGIYACITEKTTSQGQYKFEELTLPTVSLQDTQELLSLLYSLENRDSIALPGQKFAMPVSVPTAPKLEQKTVSFSATSGSVGWAPLSKAPIVLEKKEVILSIEVQSELDKLEKELSDKVEKLAKDELEISELQKKVLEKQSQIPLSKAAIEKAKKIIAAKRALAIAEAM